MVLRAPWRFSQHEYQARDRDKLQFPGCRSNIICPFTFPLIGQPKDCEDDSRGQHKAQEKVDSYIGPRVDRFTGDEEFRQASYRPDDGNGTLLRWSAMLQTPRPLAPVRTTTNGTTMFSDWNFHHGTPAGIGSHARISASQVIAAEASNAAKRRNPTASRQ